VEGLNHPEVFMMYEALIEWYTMKEQEADELFGFAEEDSGGFHLGHWSRQEHKHKVVPTKDENLTIQTLPNEYSLYGYKVFPFFRFKVGCDSKELFERQNDKLACTPLSDAPYPVLKDFKPDDHKYTVYEAAHHCQQYGDRCVGFDCHYRGPETTCHIHSCSKDNAPCYGCHEWEEQVMYNSQCVSAHSSNLGVPENCVVDIQDCLKKLGCTVEEQTCKTDGMEVVEDWQHMAFYKLDKLCKEGSLCPYYDLITAYQAEEVVRKEAESQGHETAHETA
jgi:hypothetical protein